MPPVRIRRLFAAVAALVVATAAFAQPGYAAQPAKPVISYIFYYGEERSEGDEYVVVTNIGGTAVNLLGYSLWAGDFGQDFFFPAYTLKPKASVRVYTNRTVPGAFSFGSRKGIWHNKGDCGYLYNVAGAFVSKKCY